MESGISNIRVRAQIFFNAEELESLVTLGRRNWEIANACFAGNEDTRRKWAEFLATLGNHARKCGLEASRASTELLGRYGAPEAMAATDIAPTEGL